MRAALLPFLAAVLLALPCASQEEGNGGGAGEGAPAAGPGPAESRLDDANREAAERVLRTAEREGAAITNRLAGLKAEDVIVVGGLFDFVQELLTAWRCPHTVIRPDELEHRLAPPFERKVVLLDCTLLDREFAASLPVAPDPPPAEARRRLERVIAEAGLDGPTAPGKALRERFSEVARFAGSDYSEAGLARLGEAVLAGAWVYSSDWAVLAVERALKGRIRWTGRSTVEETVEVAPSLAGRGDPMLAGVFDAQADGKPRWWLETESYLFSVRGRHTVLIESRQLGARYGGNRNVVVVLDCGAGRALHCLSHAYLQRGNADDLGAMQRLVLNWLLAKSLQNWRRDHPER